MTLDHNIYPFFVTKQILPLYLKTEICPINAWLDIRNYERLIPLLAKNYKELSVLISPYSTVPKINQDKTDNSRQILINQDTLRDVYVKK